jgi:hypothetical protein
MSNRLLELVPNSQHWNGIRLPELLCAIRVSTGNVLQNHFGAVKLVAINYPTLSEGGADIS